jgi:hypothetical protein
LSAPASIPHAAQQAAWRRLWQILLADPPAENSDTADHRRPLEAGAQLQQHEDRTTRPRNLGAAFEEDDRRERVTTTDN